MQLFPVEHVSIPLHRDPALVLRDLQAALDRHEWRHPLRDRLVGTADRNAIRIRRIRRVWDSPFTPRFEGSIGPEGTTIEGQFAQSPWASVFVAAWLCLMVCFLLFELVGIALAGFTAEYVGGLVAGTFGAAAGAALPRWNWYASADDIDEITGAIEWAAGGAGA